MRRRAPAPGALTSLLDVLFILVFASLVSASARGAAKPAPPPAPEVVAPPATSPTLAALRRAAVATVARQLEGAPLVAVRIAADGTLIELEAADGVRPVGAPLLEAVADRDVGLAYLGDRAPAAQVCAVVARALGATALPEHVIVIAPAAALAELPVALVAGLQRDIARCQRGQQALAVIVEPTTPEVIP
ncbi:MAG: hypothetical protein IPL61_04380 [Myxococcales bacterium]|nr:hypothetical protein [Myxococcales bacterium]